MPNFKSLNTETYLKVDEISNPEEKFWNNYKFPVTIKAFKAINYIDVTNVDSYRVAVSSGAKVDMYDGATHALIHSFYGTKSSQLGGTFRQDGNLIAAGTEEGIVRVYPTPKFRVSKTYRGHTEAVHRVAFVPGFEHLLSFSDDKTISLFDVATTDRISTFNKHDDFIRAGATSPNSSHTFASGSYDHWLRVWDVRTGQCTASFQHGAPIQALLWMPSSQLLFSAGGLNIKAWDLGARRCLGVLSAHHKAVTCLAVAGQDSAKCSPKLLSAGLDRQVRVHDVATLTTVARRTYDDPVVAMAILSNYTLMTGVVSRDHSSLLHFEEKLDDEPSALEKEQFAADGVRYTKKLTKEAHQIDKKLIMFEHSALLADVMTHPDMPAATTLAALRQLMRRRQLGAAMAGQDAAVIKAITGFIKEHIHDPIYQPILLRVAEAFIDVYEQQVIENPLVFKALKDIKKILERELEYWHEAVKLTGVIEMFVCASSSSRTAAAEKAKADDDVNATIILDDFEAPTSKEDGDVPSNAKEAQKSTPTAAKFKLPKPKRLKRPKIDYIQLS